MPTPVNTLDAIHLASSLIFGEQRDAFVTFDQQQSIGARALGFDVLGAAIP